MKDQQPGTPRRARSRIVLRGALVIAVAGAVAATAVALGTAANAATTLGASAAQSGRYFGTAVAAGKLSGLDLRRASWTASST